MKTAYLSLGSNLGDRLANLRAAIAALRSPELNVARLSSVYETEPQDLKAQPWFLNLVAEIETAVFPRALLGRMQRIELDLGRRRGVAKGPRPIDIDILLYGKFVIDMPGLTVPHPRLAERRFVLEPLAELAPELRHPVTRKQVREMLASTLHQSVRRTDLILNP